MVHALVALQWRCGERDGVSNHQSNDCLFNSLFRRGSKKTSKLHVTGLCEGNSPVTGEFPALRPSKAEKYPFDDVIMCPVVRYRPSWIKSSGRHSLPGEKVQFQWNRIRNSYIFLKNDIENVVCQIGGQFVEGEISWTCLNSGTTHCMGYACCNTPMHRCCMCITE